MKENIFAMFVLALILLFGAILGWAFTHEPLDDSWRDQIVEHGCAQFYLDANHDRQWRWLEKPSAEVKP